MLNPNRLNASIALSSIFAIAFALISQHSFDLAPCAWCVFQRLLFLLLALWSGLAWAVSSHQFKVMFSSLAVLTAAGGVASALYQLNLVAQQFSCAQTFADVFMTQSKLESTLPWLFGIYATCVDASVKLLGIEYAAWGLMLFVILALAAAKASMLNYRLLRNPS